MVPGNDSLPRGAYGLKLPDVPGAAELLVPAPSPWATWHLSHRALVKSDASQVQFLGPDSALLELVAGGWVEVDRRRGISTYVLPERPADTEMVHPYLASTAALYARWQGWNCVHGGGLIVDGGVWGVFGDREMGKSSSLAWFALESDAGVLCDDVLVIDSNGQALAGPRFIDLREDASRHFGVGEPLGVVGTRERWRMRLEETLPELPFRGWVELAWGDSVTLETMGPAELLTAIVRNFSLKFMPPEVHALMDLAALPAFRLTRPRRLESLVGAAERLLTAVRDSRAALG